MEKKPLICIQHILDEGSMTKEEFQELMSTEIEYCRKLGLLTEEPDENESKQSTIFDEPLIGEEK